MSNFTWISEVQAQETPVAAPNAAAPASPFAGLVPIVLMFAVLYFLLIRPQQKKINDHKKLVNDIKRGDKILTGGGIIGTVVKTEGDDVVVVEIAENVRVRVARLSISNVITSADVPANDQ